MLPTRSDRGYGFYRVENELKCLQNAVGGPIEVLPLRSNLVMVIDEEGKLKNKQKNYLATKMLKEFYPNTLDYIVGNALLVETTEEDFTNLGNENYQEIMRIFKKWGF